MKTIFGLLVISLVSIVAGCTGIDTREIKIGDKIVGHLTTYNRTADGCAHLYGSIIYDAKGELRDHKTTAGPGLACAAVVAGGMVGAAAVHGMSFPKNVGDNLNIDNENAQAQGQQQRTQQSQSQNQRQYNTENNRTFNYGENWNNW